MSPRLEGNVALITGGGRGIGRAVAIAFAAEGAAVAVSARTESQLNETVNAIDAIGGKALAIPADITSLPDVERMVAEAESALGPIDLLVNNAGTQEHAAQTWRSDPDEWRRTIDVNVYGQYLVTRAVTPGMVERRRGRVIFVSSGASVIPGGYTGFSAYGASKAAINRIAETLATEAAEFGVKSFAIHPGVVRTELLGRNVEPAVEEIAPGRGERMWEINHPPELAATLCLRLAAGDADVLSGRYMSVQSDLDHLLANAEMIKNDDLLTQRINRLPVPQSDG